MIATPRTLHELLDALAVPSEGILYVHSSVDWIRRGGFDPATSLDTLRRRAGAAGTVVMPAYPCRTTHVEYLSGAPVYDVRRTPTAAGLIAEAFRRTPGAVRSLDPDFCVAAIGGEAADIATPLAADPDPFGSDSPYQRMLDRGTTLVGLGVSLNTNSFIHLLDSRLQAQYDRPVYSADLFPASVVDEGGRCSTVSRRALSPQFQTRIAPSALVDEIGGDAETFTSFTAGGAVFFRWDLSRWYAASLAHAQARLATGQRPCWLRGLE